MEDPIRGVFAVTIQETLLMHKGSGHLNFLVNRKYQFFTVVRKSSCLIPPSCLLTYYLLSRFYCGEQ